jgi:hypothetical protein
MEYVNAPTLASGEAGKLSVEQRKQLVSDLYVSHKYIIRILTSLKMISIRHGLHVMQCCDVSQHDWHAGQILCNLSKSLEAHAVFIDFSASMQTTDIDEDLSTDDYGRCLGAISLPNSLGIDYKWVCDFWMRPEMARESWDARSMGFIKEGLNWSYRNKDPFAFVYDHEH